MYNVLNYFGHGDWRDSHRFTDSSMCKVFARKQLFTKTRGTNWLENCFVQTIVDA